LNMHQSHEFDRVALQNQLDNLPVGGILSLNTREYPGPFEIRKSLTLDGKGATVWGLSGPLVTIKSGTSVLLKNIIIEVNGDSQEAGGHQDCAIIVEPGAKVLLEQVEVYGSVVGLNEVGVWRYPKSLYLGQIQASEEHRFVIRMVVAANCTLISEISGLSLNPKQLSSGSHEVNIVLEKLRDNVLLRGRVLIETGHFKRWMVVHAHAVQTPLQLPSTSAIAWEPKDWGKLACILPTDTVATQASVPAVFTTQSIIAGTEPLGVSIPLVPPAEPQVPTVPQHPPVVPAQPLVVQAAPTRKRVRGQQIGRAFADDANTNTNSEPTLGTSVDDVTKQSDKKPEKTASDKTETRTSKTFGLGAAFVSTSDDPAFPAQLNPSLADGFENEQPESLTNPTQLAQLGLEKGSRPKTTLGLAFTLPSIASDSSSNDVPAPPIPLQPDTQGDCPAMENRSDTTAPTGIKLKPVSGLFYPNQKPDSHLGTND
jgi:hypothetical protein